MEKAWTAATKSQISQSVRFNLIRSLFYDLNISKNNRMKLLMDATIVLILVFINPPESSRIAGPKPVQLCSLCNFHVRFDLPFANKSHVVREGGGGTVVKVAAAAGVDRATDRQRTPSMTVFDIVLKGPTCTRAQRVIRSPIVFRINVSKWGIVLVFGTLTPSWLGSWLTLIGRSQTLFGGSFGLWRVVFSF